MSEPICSDCEPAEGGGWLCDPKRPACSVPASRNQDRCVPEPLKAAGLTYRQVDHWCRRGYLRPAGEGEGSGNPRWWPPSEIAVALRMAELVDEGFRHDVAARRAREQDPA